MLVFCKNLKRQVLSEADCYGNICKDCGGRILIEDMDKDENEPYKIYYDLDNNMRDLYNLLTDNNIDIKHKRKFFKSINKKIKKYLWRRLDKHYGSTLHK